MMKKPSSQCPFHSSEQAQLSFVFREAPRQNVFIRISQAISEWLSRISMHQMFKQACKKDSMISKCRTLKGTVYVTGNANVMKAIFQNPRSHQEGLFWDKETPRPVEKYGVNINNNTQMHIKCD